MKHVTLFLIASLAITACSSPDNKQTGTDTITTGDTVEKSTSTLQANGTPTVTSLCFLKTEGKANQDSTSIELVIQGNKVTGQMNWLPYQKDSRKGTLEGTIKNDTIQAVWGFMQEGMKDTLNLKLLLKNDQLSQKPLKLNTKTGRDQTDEFASYTLNYSLTTKVHH